MKKNMKYIIGRCALFWTFCFVVFLVACVSDKFDQDVPSLEGNGSLRVKIQLHVPQAAPATRALTPQDESDVKEICVLFFRQDKNNQCQWLYSATKATLEHLQGIENTNTDVIDKYEFSTSFSVEQKHVNDAFVCIVLANVSDKTDFNFISQENWGEKFTYEDIQRQVLQAVNEKLYQDNKSAIAMWGQANTDIVPANMVQNTQLSVPLLRSVARVDVIQDPGVNEKFELKEVHIFKPQDHVALLPVLNNYLKDDKKVAGPSVAEVAKVIETPWVYKQIEPTEVTIDNETKIQYQIASTIYIPETDIVMDGDGTPGGENHTKRCALVVGGTYNGEMNYYRVDFKTPNVAKSTLMNVLRNHLYQFRITDVKGRGHSSAKEAYEARTANIEATVIAWENVNNGNVAFDGARFLGVDQTEIRVRASGEPKAVLSVTNSAGLKWSAKLDDGQGKVPDWIRFNNQDNGTGIVVETQEQDCVTFDGSVEATQLGFIVDAKSATVSGERKAYIFFTADNLTLKVTVIQNESDEVFITVQSLYTVSNTGNPTLKVPVTFGSRGATLSWKITTADFIDYPYFSGDFEGEFESDDTNGGIKTFEFDIPQWPVNEGWGTKEILLSLTATAENGNRVTQNVLIQQKKKGVTLLTKYDMLFATKEAKKVYVLSNFNWNVNYDAGSTANKDVGTMINGLVVGTKTDGPATSRKSEQSFFMVDTKEQVGYQAQIPQAHFTFTDEEEPTAAPIDVTLPASPVWQSPVDQQMYMVTKLENANISAYIDGNEMEFDGWKGMPLTALEAESLSKILVDEEICFVYENNYIMQKRVDNLPTGPIQFFFVLHYYKGGTWNIANTHSFLYFTIQSGGMTEYIYQSEESFKNFNKETGVEQDPKYNTFTRYVSVENTSTSFPWLYGRYLLLPDYSGNNQGKYLVDLDLWTGPLSRVLQGPIVHPTYPDNSNIRYYGYVKIDGLFVRNMRFVDMTASLFFKIPINQ